MRERGRKGSDLTWVWASISREGMKQRFLGTTQPWLPTLAVPLSSFAFVGRSLFIASISSVKGRVLTRIQ